MYDEYPYGNNNNKDGRYVPLDSSQYHIGPAYRAEEPGSAARRQKKSKVWIALLLVCVIALGAAGGGVYYLLTRGDANTNAATIQMGQREPVQLNTMQVATGEKMTLPEVYAAYVNSTVGITTETVAGYNVFGQKVSGVTAGSGFVVSENGYILTNYHVVEGANSIQVTMYDETKYDAALVGYDESNDVAVLKVEAAGLKPVVLGNSDNMYVGEAVMAIGNPLGELTFTATQGTISALDRSVTISGTSYNAIQTDCAINEGNSGGPLFNEYGEVIGIVSAKYASSEIEGLGFAIPINDITELLEDILENGRVTGRPSMGITVSTVTEATARQYNLQVGACVNEVEAGSCAEAAGLQQGDIITAIGGAAVTSKEDLIEQKQEYKAGETTTLTVFRSGETLSLSITFDEEVQSTDLEGNTGNPSGGQFPGNGYYYQFPFGGYGY